MKKMLTRLALLSAFVAVVSFTGCKNYDGDIKKINQTTADLQSQIDLLKGLRAWAEEQNADLQDQIDDLNDNLAEAQRLLAAGLSDDELRERFDALVAGSTLIIAEIEELLEENATTIGEHSTTLEEHDAQIEELYELIRGIGGGGSGDIGEQIVTILQDIDYLEDEVDDIWVAIRNINNTINNIGGGGGGDTYYYGITVEELEAALADMMDDLVQSVTFVAQTSDELDYGLSWNVFLNRDETFLHAYVNTSYLVAPRSMIDILDDEGTVLEGVLNRLTTPTRAIMDVNIPAEVVATSRRTGEITVKYDLTSLEELSGIGTGYEFQIALRIKTGNGKEIVSDFVRLSLIDEVPNYIFNEIELGDWYNRGETANRDVDVWAPGRALGPHNNEYSNILGRDGMGGPTPFENIPGEGFLGFPEEGNLKLDILSAHDNWYELLNPEVCYTEAVLFFWNDKRNEWEQSRNVVINGDNELVMPSGLKEGVHYRVIVSFKVTADNLNNCFEGLFAVDLPFYKYVDEFVIKKGVLGGHPITIPEEGLTYTTDDTSFLLVATEFRPKNATNKNVTWSSSNPDVVTVDPESGVVTIVGKGTATITATALGSDPDCPAVTACVEVTIVQLVTDIAIGIIEDGDFVEIPDGEGLTLSTDDDPNDIPQLVVEVEPAAPNAPSDPSVEWESSDEDVVTVDEDGNITIVGPGEATITATAKDGSGKTDEITITVLQPVITITIPETATVKANGTTTVAPVTFTPDEYIDQTVVWTIEEGGTLATINEETGLITAGDAVGTIKVRVAWAKDTSVYDECEVTIVPATGGLPYPLDDLDEIDWRINGKRPVYRSERQLRQWGWFMWWFDYPAKAWGYGDSVGDALTINGDTELDLEEYLEGLYGVGFSVTYEIEQQANHIGIITSWSEHRNPGNQRARIDNGNIVNVGNATGSGGILGIGSDVGDRLVIKITVNTDPAGEDPLPEPLVQYICLDLP